MRRYYSKRRQAIQLTSLEMVEVPQPTDDRVPTGENLAHHHSVLHLQRLAAGFGQHRKAESNPLLETADPNRILYWSLLPIEGTGLVPNKRLELLLRAVQPALHRYVRGVIGPLHADDVNQEVLLIVYRKLWWLTSADLFRP